MNAAPVIAPETDQIDSGALPSVDHQISTSDTTPNGYYQYARHEVLDLIPAAVGRLLDVGCGAGVLGAAVKAAGGATVHGVELMPEIAAIAATRLDYVWSGAVEEVLPQLPDGNYDCIVVADVLEHLVDPLAVLRALRDKLAPGGVIVASIPNLQNWGVLSALIEGRFEYASEGILDRTHLRFFTRRSAEALFWSAGLHIETMSTTVRGPALPESIATDCERAGLDGRPLRRDARTFQFLIRAHQPVITMPRVAIVVLNWNGRDDTLRCLSSLALLTYPNYEVVVVDNGSADGSAPSIRSKFPDVTVIETGKNLGYAGGNNIGIARALDCDVDYVLVLNNDTVVAPDFLSELVHSAACLPRGSVIGSAMLFDDRPELLWMLGGTWDHQSASFRDDGANQPLENFADSVREVDYVVGCSLLAPRHVFDRIGLFDEDYFLHYEEIDFCSRARKAGLRCFVATGAKLWHKVAAASGGDSSPLVKYFRTRNLLLWAKRHLPPHEARRVSLRAWSQVHRILLPSPGAIRLRLWSPRHIYWHAASWLKMVQRNVANEHNWALLVGVRDHYLRRYGDCPPSIRKLGTPSAE